MTPQSIAYAAGDIAASLNDTGIKNFIVGTIIPLALLVIGFSIMLANKRGDWSGTASRVGIVIVGLFVALGAPLIIGWVNGDLLGYTFK